MPLSKVHAITFDLWDTVFVDDSDEPKRKAQGLPPKAVERRKITHEFLLKHAPIDRVLVDTAYDTMDVAFARVWHEHFITWKVSERLKLLLKGLGRTLPPEDLDELVRLHEEMELKVCPDLAPGIKAALQALHGKYKLGVISDTIFSPGRVLRKLLEKDGLLELFDTFIFSDELGCAKPAPMVFEAAAINLGLTPFDIVHIGDREPNDIEGAHSVGGRAILTTVVKDRGRDTTLAETVCDDYSQLSAQIAALEQA